MTTNNPKPVVTGELKVTQSDRDAAALIMISREAEDKVRRGEADSNPVVQAFAAHRAAHAASDHLIDMANVGEALMEAIRDYSSDSFMQGWHPADCPSEIVGDLLNALDESRTAHALPGDGMLDRIEATIEAAERCMNASPFWDENSRHAGKALLDYPRSQIAHERAALTPSALSEKVVKPGFQTEVGDWMLECFGQEIASDRLERGDRWTEEALELAQTIPGFTADRAHALVDYVFARPVGERGQEVGGSMVTLAALCNSFGLNIAEEAERELARVWTKVEAIRTKQAAKPTGSALPVAAPSALSGDAGEGEKVAAWLEQYPTPLDDLDMAMRIRKICAAIRNGEHLK